MAFITGSSLPPTRFTISTLSSKCDATRRVVMSSQAPSLSRRELLHAALAVTASVVAARPQSASAANGAGLERAFSKVLFPKEGFNAPETETPAADQALLGSPEAKAALAKLRSYQQNITDLYAKFQAEPKTTELSSTVRGMVSISDLRNALNVVNEAIDELAQVETDKVVRGIIQDIGELENAGALKPGTSRTEKKIVRTFDWFDKLERDFQRLLSFYA